MDKFSSAKPAQNRHRIAEIKFVKPSKSLSENVMASSPTKVPLMKRLIRWICPDQRVASRHPMPPLTAWLGMVRTSKEYKVANVSVAGFYMLTEDRWIPGTAFPVTLQRTDDAGLGQSLTVYATVVRCSDDGVGFSFLQNPSEETAEGPAGVNSRLDLTKIAQCLKGIQLSDPTSDQLERAS